MKNLAIALRRKFFRELPEYGQLLASQGGGCKICGRPPHKNKLSIDHAHEVDKIKVVVSKFGLGWFAEASWGGEHFYDSQPTKRLAWESVKIMLFRRSIRGLLCFLCNGGIQHFEDSKAPLKPAERFDAAAKYFRDFEGSFNGPTSTRR